MKITKQLIKEMIEEEIASINEESSSKGPSKEEIAIGKSLANSPIGKEVFKQMDANPEIQKALAQIQKQMNENDPSYGDVAGQYGAVGSMGGAALSANAAKTALFTGVLSGKAGAAALGILKAAGLVGGGLVGGAIVGYLLYKGFKAVAGE